MAKYDYKCKNCDYVFVAELSYKDTHKKPKCPKCGSGKTRKIIALPSIHYKGDGFTKSVQSE
jgi:putative FmdB family regulatory protein